MPDTEHPWLGLQSFTEETKNFFFGRDEEIRDIFRRVREHALTTLFGKSGLGKTSLLGAGLIPKLKVEGFRPVLIRLRFEEYDPPLVTQVYQAIRAAIDAPANPPANGSGESAAPGTLWEMFHHLPIRSPALVEQPVVIIFDQLEEIFTLTISRDRQREAEELFCQLADFVENRPPAAVHDRLLAERRSSREYDLMPSASRIVITLREDFLSQLEAWKKLMPSLMRNRMALQLLTGRQALEAVVQPGRMGGKELVDETVGARIVCYVAGCPADTPLEQIGAVPPLLSLLCDELNSTRIARGEAVITESQATEQSGDILQLFYNRSFANLHPAVRSLVEDELISVGGHRSSMPHEDAIAILQGAGVSNPAQAIQQLVTGRLLSTEDRGGLQRLEITHDVLTPLAVRSRNERKAREAKELAERKAREAEQQAREESIAHDRRLRRARLMMAIYGIIAAVLLVACIYVWNLRSIAMQQADDAKRAQAIATQAVKDANKANRDKEEANEALRQQAYNNSIAIAERELTQNHDVERASRLLESETCPPHLRGWEWHYLMRLRDGAAPPLAGHGSGVYGVEYSPDGSLLATCSIDGNVKIWNPKSGALIRTIDADDLPLLSAVLPLLGVEHIPIMCLAFSPDGKQLATGSLYPQGKVDLSISFTPLPDRDSPGLVRIWDVATGKLLKSFQDQKGIVLALTYTPDGKQILSSSINPDNSFVAFDVETGKVIKRVRGHQGQIHQLGYSPDKKLLATSDTTGVVKLWDATTLTEIRSITAHPAPVIGFDFSNDGSQFATAAQDGAVRVWETATGRKLKDFEGHAGAALDVHYSPDGQRIASSGADKTIRMWDAATGESKLTLRGHEEMVWSIAFSPDGQQIASASWDKTARIWDATPRQEIADGELALGGNSRVNCLAFSRDGELLVTGDWDAQVKIWNSGTGEELKSFPGHTATVFGVAINPEKTRLASVSWDHTVRIWDVATGQTLHTLTDHTAPVHSVAFSPSGDRIATGAFDGNVKIWNVETGKLLANCDGFIFPVFTVAFSPDGKQVASGGADRVVKVWNAANGQLVFKFKKEHQASIYSLAYNAEGTQIVSSSWDHGAFVWDLKSRQRVLKLKLRPELKEGNADFEMAHEDRVNSVAFSPDGKRIATCSEDKTVRLWDANTGLQVSPPRHLREFAWSVAFTPDGSRLAVGCWEQGKPVRIWKMD